MSASTAETMSLNVDDGGTKHLIFCGYVKYPFVLEFFIVVIVVFFSSFVTAYASPIVVIAGGAVGGLIIVVTLIIVIIVSVCVVKRNHLGEVHLNTFTLQLHTKLRH